MRKYRTNVDASTYIYTHIYTLVHIILYKHTPISCGIYTWSSLSPCPLLYFPLSFPFPFAMFFSSWFCSVSSSLPLLALFLLHVSFYFLSSFVLSLSSSLLVCISVAFPFSVSFPLCWSFSFSVDFFSLYAPIDINIQRKWYMALWVDQPEVMCRPLVSKISSISSRDFPLVSGILNAKTMSPTSAMAA